MSTARYADARLEIQKIDASACIHRLLALEGAICGVKKTLLPDKRNIYGTGAWQAGEIKTTAAYDEAYEMGKNM